MSKADFNKIQKLLKTVTAYRISKATGIGDTTISRWVTGKTPIEKMSLENAIKLTNYAEELDMEIAKQLLETIKNNDVAYAIVNEDGAVYCNSETSNIMDIYGHDGEDGHFYGIYGDAVGGQLDSRNVSDDVILKGIQLMLGLGEPVKRSELSTGSDFKPTYLNGYFEVVELIKQSGLLQEQEENDKVKEWIESHKDVVGSIVKHPSFGTGKVTEITDNTITIDFEDSGSKSLALNAVVESNLLEF
nr:MAG TPA: ATP-dependent DNA helicase [Caudoviricetes sp.]